MLSQKFVQATREYSTYQSPVAAPYMRRSFTLDSIPKNASLTITCTGFYRLFVNGNEITDGVLAPGITNPDEILFYDSYDIAKYLKFGKNTLGFWLGNGFANSVGGYIWDFDTARFRAAPALAFSFDSETLQFEADESVLCHPSPIVFDDLRSGEHYDARREMSGWNLPEFDDGDWSPAIQVEPARGEYVMNDTDRVVLTEEVRPVKVFSGCLAKDRQPSMMNPRSLALCDTTFYQIGEGERGTVFAFENNLSSVPHLRVKGKPGQVIAIQAAEYCTPEGEVINDAIQKFYPFGFCQRDVYICRGDGTVEEYIPSFTYHGARYYFVIGLDEDQITEDTLTAHILHSNIGERGDFSCSNEVANKLVQCTKNSLYANFVYFPTDCPHREKNGWTGDAATSAEYMTQFFRADRSLGQWLRMIEATQKPDGRLPGIIPTTGWGFHWGNGPVWDRVITEVPYQLYVYQNDLSLFDTVSDTVFRYLNYLSKNRTRRGTIDFGLGDYAGGRSSASNYLCPEEITSTVMSYRICCQAAEMYAARDLSLQAEFANKLGEEFREAFRKHLIDLDTMTVYGNCQTAQAIAIDNGLLTPGESHAAYRVLLDMIRREDDHIAGGMLACRTVFRLLAKYGDAELAWKMIMRTDGPSHADWIVNHGLSSLAERHMCIGDPGRDMSLNHHWMGDFIGFFMAHIAGLQINPTHTDAMYVRVAPCFIGDLEHAEAHYESVCGPVDVKWERTGEHIRLQIEKLDAIWGEVVLPNGYRFIDKTGEKDFRMFDRKVFALDRGIYTIEKIPT